MEHFIVAKDELPHSGSAHRFEGYLYGGADVSFFVSDTPPGKGPSLHTPTPRYSSFMMANSPSGWERTQSRRAAAR